MTLATKSLTDLRGIAQSLKIPDVFKKERAQLLQAIELKQAVVTPKIERPAPYALTTERAADLCDETGVTQLLQPYIAIGLHVSFEGGMWHMKRGNKSDSGTMKMPLRTVLRCAGALMK